MRSLCLLTLFAVLCFLAVSGTNAFAHPGHDHPAWEVDEFEDEAFMVGLMHPFTGVDHLVAMLAVGVLAFMTRWRLAVACAGAIGLGALHGGAVHDLRFGVGLCVGTVAGVLLSVVVARGLKGLPLVAARIAGATG